MHTNVKNVKKNVKTLTALFWVHLSGHQPNRAELLFRIRSGGFFAQVEIISYPATGLMYIFGKILTAVKAIP